LNRLDEIVFYKPLTKENINGIVDLLIADLNKRLKDKQLKVEITDAAKEHIIDSAYDPIYGARPLKRFIQSKIETLLAREIIGGDMEPDSVIHIDYNGSDLTLQSYSRWKKFYRSYYHSIAKSKKRREKPPHF